MIKNCNFDKYPQLNKPFKIIAFDWDGTAVANRKADASQVTEKLEELLNLGVYIAVITGTNFQNIDSQFSSLIEGKHKQRLFICANRGSEVYNFDAESNSVLKYRYEASVQENVLLDKIVEKTKQKIENTSAVKVEVIYDRLNRRKLDLIPEWKDPQKSEIDELLAKTQEKLEKGCFAGGIQKAFKLMQDIAKISALTKAKITTDVKHIEVGLTDKSDSIKWILDNIAIKNNISNKDILISGDEFGSIGGFEGSDHRMILENALDITYFSVGIEPNGISEPVLHLGGGPECFIKLIEKQIYLNTGTKI